MIPVKTIDLSSVKEVTTTEIRVCEHMVYGDGEPLLSLFTEGSAASVTWQLQALVGQVVTVYRIYDRTHMHTFYRVLEGGP